MSRIIALSCVMLMVGCAQVHIRPLTKIEREGKAMAEGVRFYRPWPYLLVTVETGKDSTQFKNQIVYLPQISEEYVVNVQPGWGTANGSVKLQDGWNLAELGATTDSKIPETITAVSGLITAAGGVAAMNAVPKGTEGLLPGLYRFEFSEDGYVSRLVQVPLPTKKVE